MDAILPCRFLHIDQPEIRFADQIRRLERVALTLANHVASRQPAQLFVKQRDELVRRRLVAAFGGREECRDL